MPGRPDLYLIRRPDEVAAAFSPVRNQICLVLEMLGQASVAEMAVHLGRSPESLYYHIRILERAGLLQAVETAATAERDEAVYALPAKRIRIDTSVRNPKFRAAFAKTARTLFRFAERCYLRGIASPDTRIEGSFRELRQIQVTARLGRRDVIELNRRLLDLESFLGSRDNPDLPRRYVVTLALSPTDQDAGEDQ